MNRYTYKAKRKDNGEWVYGFYNYIFFKYDYSEKRHVIMGYDEQGLFFEDKIMPETLCQCTGVKDTEGNYIFENDIVEVPSFIEENQKAICIYNEEHNVNDIIGFGLYTYDNYHQRYSNLIQSDEWDEFKIIGNKFDEVK